MHGLVSLLPEPFFAQVESTWQELERDFGLTGVLVTPFPHFSWQVVEDYGWERIADVMQEIARQTSPLRARATGLGLFTGERPVIYVPVVKNAELMRLHQLVWERTAEVSMGRLACYAPGAWMPHVSLACEDVHRGNVGRVMERLAGQGFDWEMVVDNIALIYVPTGVIGTLKHKFEFG
jgi:2'-5' RNA ligase